MATRVWLSRSEPLTLRLGGCLAQAVRLPVWIGLDGSLGVGKTRFVQGFAAEIGVTGRVQSPTYVIENRYAGRVPLWHQDLYRLTGPDDEIVAGWEENESGVILVEWAARADELPERAIHVRMERVDSGEVDGVAAAVTRPAATSSAVAADTDTPTVAADAPPAAAAATAPAGDAEAPPAAPGAAAAELDFADNSARRIVVTWSSADLLDVDQLDRAVAAVTAAADDIAVPPGTTSTGSDHD